MADKFSSITGVNVSADSISANNRNGSIQFTPYECNSGFEFDGNNHWWFVDVDSHTYRFIEPDIDGLYEFVEWVANSGEVDFDAAIDELNEMD